MEWMGAGPVMVVSMKIEQKIVKHLKQERVKLPSRLSIVQCGYSENEAAVSVSAML